MSSRRFTNANMICHSRKVITATIRIGNTMQGGSGVVTPYTKQVMVVPVKVPIRLLIHDCLTKCVTRSI